ncbi:hypothetical protein [Mycobacterium tilburgii]|uniref:hypothetical protein n=1 Tax=Mycobacterium tilburgii TaxID=44467 RepID=UPI001184036B|nr:hypothetical protein [Mycobacterium tilburgii]
MFWARLKISVSPSDADAHAPDAVLSSESPKPKLAGSSAVEGDTRPKFCKVGRMPVADEATGGEVAVACAMAVAWPPIPAAWAAPCGGRRERVQVAADADTAA